MLFRARVILLTIFAALISIGAMAQQEIDYLKYKFLTESEEAFALDEDMLWWLAEDVDSVRVPSSSSDGYRFLALGYALRGVEYSPRGEERSEEQHLVGDINVGYATARLISALGIERGEATSPFQPSTYGRSRTYNIYNMQPGTTSHRIRAELSGRNYLGSISYRATYPIYNTVKLKSDWQLSHYIRINSGPDLYIEAVEGNGVDVAVAAQRNWRNNSLFIAAMVPWSKRAARQYSVEEAFRLTDNHHYNPSWGVQNGKMRNSRHNSTLRPEVVASWWRRLGGWSDINISFRGAVERTGRRALEWFDAPTPMPDNYRYLPSYYDGETQRLVTDAWHYNNLKYTQIDWDALYATNALQRDGHAVYAVGNRRSNNIAADIVAKVTTKLRGFDIDYGALVDIDSKRAFKVADDLLGANHILNIDYFIRDDATYSSKYRNNLRDNDLKIKRNQHYGYDYRLTRWNVGIFGVARWSIAGFDCEAGVNLSYVNIQRRGYFEKELLAGHRSYGKSRAALFYPSSFNARCEYHLGNNLFKAAVAVRGNAPREEAAFLQTDYNNRLADNLRTGVTVAADIGYEYSNSKIALRTSLFLSHHTGECDILRYYDDLAEEYVDAVVSDIARLNFGVEAEAMVRWSQYLSSEFKATLGRYRYAANPTVTIYADNDNHLIARTTSQMKGIHSSYPEISAYGNISFRRDGWRATAALDYWGIRHVTPSFTRRTERVLNYAPSHEGREGLQYQQRLGDAVALSINAAKSFKFANGLWLNIQLSIDNLLNSKIIYGGYEQDRVRRINNAYYTSLEPFANKLSYAYGRVIRLSVSLGF